MTRRTSRPAWLAEDADFGPGWARHEGGPCPVEPTDHVALILRSGTRISAGFKPASHWDYFAGGSLWEWQGRKPDGFDILAYSVEESQAAR